MPRRASGILLHPTSLAGGFGIGDFGPNACDFLRWLALAGQSVWQILPLGPPGLGNSPYLALSSFAGNPLLISPQRLEERGLLRPGDLPSWMIPSRNRVDFPAATALKDELLRRFWQQIRDAQGPGELQTQYREWCGDSSQSHWLDDWCLYAAIKHDRNGQPWYEWPGALRWREPGELNRARRQLADEIAYQAFLQFLFFQQWFELQGEARRLGISILGDLPFYVALDSCDVWVRPDLFDLDEEGQPRHVAGVPPDYFSATGQRWGNPVYRWEKLVREHYTWWIERLAFQLRLVDRVRLDHFRGFAGYWEIPAREPTAEKGHWRPGPGREFFAAALGALGALPLVAEDLGVITEDVDELRESLQLPGMKVLQFAFDAPESPHLPHHLTPQTVLYTGTHDNDTAQGWIDGASDEVRRRALDYAGGTIDELHWSLIRLAMTSVAELVIIPIQDVLGLGSDDRMNLPGTAEGNWGWRLPAAALDEAIAERLLRLTVVADRRPESSALG